MHSQELAQIVYEIYNKGRWEEHYHWFHHHHLTYLSYTVHQQHSSNKAQTSTLLQDLYVPKTDTHMLAHTRLEYLCCMVYLSLFFLSLSLTPPQDIPRERTGKQWGDLCLRSQCWKQNMHVQIWGEKAQNEEEIKNGPMGRKLVSWFSSKQAPVGPLFVFVASVN